MQKHRLIPAPRGFAAVKLARFSNLAVQHAGRCPQAPNAGPRRGLITRPSLTPAPHSGCPRRGNLFRRMAEGATLDQAHDHHAGARA